MPNGGLYTLKVQAVDGTQNPITATISSYGLVDGVNIVNSSSDSTSSSSSSSTTSQAVLDVGGISVQMTELMAVNPTINPSN